MKRRWLALSALLLIAALALGGYLYERHRTGCIYHPHARFVPEAPPKRPARGPDRSAWPLYGYDKNHTRFFPGSDGLRPPFKQLWTHGGNVLLEFPPVLYGSHLFQLSDDGVLRAINKHTGHSFWNRPLGALSASTPAVGGNTVYATVLSRSPHLERGRVAAVELHHRRRSAGRATCRAPASPPRCSTTAGSSSAPRTAPCTR